MNKLKMKHITITKDNLIAFGKDSICILVPVLTKHDHIKVTNSFTGTSLILNYSNETYKHFSVYEIDYITVYLCTLNVSGNFNGYIYVNEKLTTDLQLNTITSKPINYTVT